MDPHETPIHIDTMLALLLVASATAVVIKWVRIPYAVALVIAGLAIGLSKVLPPVSMTPELVLLIFLPALLFEASWNLDIKALKRDWLSISVLATLGVVVCMLGVAAILHYAFGFHIQTALLFGAMVSATDPVSVIALFRQMGIDKRLTMILEGESLFNDGTAVVLFKIMLGIIISGGQFAPVDTIGSFFAVVLGGAALGSLMGYVASRVTSAFDDHLLEITLTMVTAYGAYLLAEQLHVSAVIAVVCAGIVFGNYGSHSGMSESTRMAVNSFWEYAAFLVNSLLFLLIGLQVQVTLLIQHSREIGLGVVAVVVARLLVVYGICPFVSTGRLPIPIKWRHLMFWGGLRGALVMALALSIPLSFPERGSIINMTFGVVLFTLLVPGLTMEPLVRALGMAPKKNEKPAKYKEYNALIMAYNAELQQVNHLYEDGKLSKSAYLEWQKQLGHVISTIAHQMQSLHLSDSSADQSQDRQVKIELLENRKVFINNLVVQGKLNEDSVKHLMEEFDSDLEQIATVPGRKLPAKDVSNESTKVLKPSQTQIEETIEKD
jgi:monovalent cation:H+ antiporter, CPA1 family